MRKLVSAACATPLALTAFVAVTNAQTAPRLRSSVLDLTGPGSSIGVAVAEVGDEAAKTDTNVTGGAVVTRVDSGTPAERAGFRVGDVVVEFDGERVRSARQFARLVQETPPNRAVEAVVVREGSRSRLKVTPETGRASFFSVAPNVATSVTPRFLTPDQTPAWGQFFTPAGGRLGAAVIALDEQLASYFGVSDGVLVTSVGVDTPAARAGLKAGDVITEAGGRKIAEPSEVTDAMRTATPGSSVELRIMRDKKEQTLKVALPEPPQPRFQLERNWNRNSI